MSTEAQKQEAPSHAGERIAYRGPAGVQAARRVIGLLLTLREATLVFDKEARVVVIREVDTDPDGVWSPGDKVIDYEECTAIKELLERAEDEWNSE